VSRVESGEKAKLHGQIASRIVEVLLLLTDGLQSFSLILESKVES